MNRRRRLLGLALLAVLSFYGFLHLPGWSAALLRHGLASYFRRPASVGSVRFHLVPVEVEVRDVRVAGPTPADPPFLEVPRLVAAPALSPFWVGEVVLSRLLVQGAEIRVRAFPDGSDDLPHFSGDTGGSGLRVERLVLERGELKVNDQRVPLDLELPAFRGRLLRQRSGAMGGTVAFGPGGARFGNAAPLPVGTEMDVILEGGRITVTAAHLTAQRTDIAYSGRIDLVPRLHGDLTLAGAADLGVLDGHVVHSGLDLEGTARFDGRLDIDVAHFTLEGRVEGKDGSFKGVSAARFAGRVTWTQAALGLRDLDVSTLGGSARVDIQVPLRAGQARLKGRIEGLDAEGLLMPLFAIGAAGIDAAATGDVSLEWPRGAPRRLSGEIVADLVPRGDDRTPVSGRFEGRAETGALSVQRADFRTPLTWARLSGAIDADDRTDLAVDVESTDLGASDDLLARLRRALGAAAVPTGLAGAGSFHGRWRGTLQAPVVEGRFTGKDVAYLGVVWGAADWAGTVTKEEVVSHSLVLRRPGGEIWLDGRSDTGNPGVRDGIDIRVRLKAWPAPDLVRALGLATDLGGLLTGEAAISGRRSAPEGSIHVASPEGRWLGVPFAHLEVDAALRGDTTEITAGSARVAGGDVSFKGSRTTDGLYSASAEARGVDAGALLSPVTPTAAVGRPGLGNVVARRADRAAHGHRASRLPPSLPRRRGRRLRRGHGARGGRRLAPRRGPLPVSPGGRVPLGTGRCRGSPRRGSPTLGAGHQHRPVRSSRATKPSRPPRRSSRREKAASRARSTRPKTWSATSSSRHSRSACPSSRCGAASRSGPRCPMEGWRSATCTSPGRERIWRSEGRRSCSGTAPSISRPEAPPTWA